MDGKGGDHYIIMRLTMFAQDNLSPTKQALNNVSGGSRVYALRPRCYACLLSVVTTMLAHAGRKVRSSLPSFFQPRYQLQRVSRIVGSDVSPRCVKLLLVIYEE
jgi:hypothetical protein